MLMNLSDYKIKKTLNCVLYHIDQNRVSSTIISNIVDSIPHSSWITTLCLIVINIPENDIDLFHFSNSCKIILIKNNT